MVDLTQTGETRKTTRDILAEIHAAEEWHRLVQHQINLTKESLLAKKEALIRKVITGAGETVAKGLVASISNALELYIAVKEAAGLEGFPHTDRETLRQEFNTAAKDLRRQAKAVAKELPGDVRDEVAEMLDAIDPRTPARLLPRKS